jgi:MYXO-CTERM domain-containing protein
MPGNSLTIPVLLPNGMADVDDSLGPVGVAGFGSFIKRIGNRVTNVVKAVAPVAAPIVGGVVGGPAGMLVGQSVGQAFQPSPASLLPFATPTFVPAPAPAPAALPMPVVAEAWPTSALPPAPRSIAMPASSAGGLSPNTLIIIGGIGLAAVLLLALRRR